MFFKIFFVIGFFRGEVEVCFYFGFFGIFVYSEEIGGV